MLNNLQGKNIKFFTKYGINGASTRYRFYQYFKFLQEKGASCDVISLFDDSDLVNLYENNGRSLFRLIYLFFRRVRVLLSINIRNTDFLIIYTELFPYIPPFFEFLLKLKKVPYILDYDDAIFHQYDKHSSRVVRFFLGKKISYIMKHAELVIAGNKYIENYAIQSGVKRVEIIPTVVDMNHYASTSSKKNQTFTIVWIGSPSTSNYLNHIAPALAKICKKRNIKVELIGVGNIDLPGVVFESFSWSKETEFELLSRCHVGIMPLTRSSWEKGKCGLKIIQYMACKLPVVASPVGVNTEIVNNGVNGYLVDSLEDWESRLIELYDNPEQLESFGKNGRKKIKSEYSLQKYAQRYVDIINSIKR
jgi:glycosyltransferase involved in cell wall biosynthesis